MRDPTRQRLQCDGSAALAGVGLGVIDDTCLPICFPRGRLGGCRRRLKTAQHRSSAGSLFLPRGAPGDADALLVSV